MPAAEMTFIGHSVYDHQKWHGLIEYICLPMNQSTITIGLSYIGKIGDIGLEKPVFSDPAFIKVPVETVL